MAIFKGDGHLTESDGEQLRVLIVVKTYPNPSQKYGETVCCAGIDLATHAWVRIYPVNFRRLAAKFKKYQIIECSASKPTSDKRTESRRVDQDTIRPIGDPLPTSDYWRQRLAWLPPLYPSLEAIQDEHRRSGITLAAFRPAAITRLVIGKPRPWTQKQLGVVRQKRLNLGEDDSRELQELEQIPVTFSYRLRCDDRRCRGHKKRILDWEIGESYRKWRRKYGSAWEAKLRQRYESELPNKSDVLLVVGTMKAHPHTFTIVGLIYPPRPKVKPGSSSQLTLKLLDQ